MRRWKNIMFLGINIIYVNYSLKVNDLYVVVVENGHKMKKMCNGKKVPECDHIVVDHKNDK